MLTQFRKISLLMAYTVATIPLWHYITDANILMLMMAIIVFAYLNVVLSSIDDAKAILSSEKAKTPLPRWLPNKLKYEKWWLIVRHTVKWHMLLIPAKMGLALGFTQWLYIVPQNRANNLLDPYFYTGNTYISTNLPFPQSAYPQWETTLIAVIVLIVFSVTETLFLSSLILSTQGRLMSILVKKVNIALLLIAVSSVFSTGLWFLRPCDRCYGQDEYFLTKRVEDTFVLATNTSIEQGVLLAANIMRPVGKISSFAIRDWSNPNPEPDNRLFVLRQCVAGILGIFLYLGTTWAILWFTEDERLHEQSEKAQTRPI